MLNIAQRNLKVFHIIESTISDFCKLLDCDYYLKDESILVTYDGEDIFFIFLEFQKDKYQIDINCIVYSDLPTSKTAKLREIYRSDEITEYTDEARVDLWFINDGTLVMSYMLEQKYSDYAVLKSR